MMFFAYISHFMAFVRDPCGSMWHRNIAKTPSLKPQPLHQYHVRIINKTLLTYLAYEETKWHCSLNSLAETLCPSLVKSGAPRDLLLCYTLTHAYQVRETGIHQFPVKNCQSCSKIAFSCIHFPDSTFYALSCLCKTMRST